MAKVFEFPKPLKTEEQLQLDHFMNLVYAFGKEVETRAFSVDGLCSMLAVIYEGLQAPMEDLQEVLKGRVPVKVEHMQVYSQAQILLVGMGKTILKMSEQLETIEKYIKNN